MNSTAKKPFCPSCDLPMVPGPRGAFLCGICKQHIAYADAIWKTTTLAASEIQNLPRSRTPHRLLTRRSEAIQYEEDQFGVMRIVHTSWLNVPTWKLWVSIFGLPVEENEYSTKITPYVTYSYIAICLAIFGAMPLLNRAFAFDPTHPLRNGGLNFFTYSLAHGSWGHVLGNLGFIWSFMDNVEEEFGHWGFVIFLVISAVASSALHFLFDRSGLPLVGASGVCFAVATYYALTYPKNRFLIAVPIFGIFAWRRRIRIRVWLLVSIYFVLELLQVNAQIRGQGHVSHLCHVGGILAGIVFATFRARRVPLREDE